MGQPKKQKSPRKTGLGRSHLVLDLARRVNAKSPVKVHTTKRETGKNTDIAAPKAAKTAKTAKTAKPIAAKAKKPAAATK